MGASRAEIPNIIGLEAARRPDARNHCPWLTGMSVVKLDAEGDATSVGLAGGGVSPGETRAQSLLLFTKIRESMESGSQGELPEQMGLVVGHKNETGLNTADGFGLESPTKDPTAQLVCFQPTYTGQG